MTMFAPPDVIECPSCGLRLRRSHLYSFNYMWSTQYSDGGVDSTPADATPALSRCQGCSSLILNVNQLPSVKLDYEGNKRPWYKKLLRRKPRWDENPAYKYQQVKRPTYLEWFELFEIEVEQPKKLQCALKVMRDFNQQFMRKGDNLDISNIEKHPEILARVEKYILDALNDDNGNDSLLLRADILRRQGKFEESYDLLESVTQDSDEHLVEQFKKWAFEGNTYLMPVDVK